MGWDGEVHSRKVHLPLPLSCPAGFPPVMANVVVSSTTDKNIALLRDIIYEVSCSLKGGVKGGVGEQDCRGGCR